MLLGKKICSHILSLELVVTSSRFKAGKSRCDRCGECLMKSFRQKNTESENVLKRSENIISSFHPSALLDYVEFTAGHVKLSVFKTSALKSLTRAGWQDAAPQHCEHKPHAVAFTRMWDDIEPVIQSNAVLAGVFQPAGCPRRPSTITRMMTFIVTEARTGPECQCLRCQSIKPSELSSWQLDATIGWDDAWLIIRYWSQVRPSSRCAGKVID